MLVINRDFLPLHYLGFKPGKPLFVAKAIVCLPFLNQLFGILQIDSLLLPL